MLFVKCSCSSLIKLFVSKILVKFLQPSLHHVRFSLVLLLFSGLVVFFLPSYPRKSKITGKCCSCAKDFLLRTPQWLNTDKTTLEFLILGLQWATYVYDRLCLWANQMALGASALYPKTAVLVWISSTGGICVLWLLQHDMLIALDQALYLLLRVMHLGISDPWRIWVKWSPLSSLHSGLLWVWWNSQGYDLSKSTFRIPVSGASSGFMWKATKRALPGCKRVCVVHENISLLLSRRAVLLHVNSMAHESPIFS